MVIEDVERIRPCEESNCIAVDLKASSNGIKAVVYVPIEACIYFVDSTTVKVEV